jgi:predicted hydrocarbon binding protein
MTHTLHRRGTAESLSKDYVLIMLRAIDINDRDYLPKVQEFLRIALRHNPVNLGSEMKGSMYEFPPEEVIADAKGDSHVVFDNPKAVTEFLKEVKDADLGLSVVVSGIFEIVDKCLEEAGLKHHTANFSLGIWGKTEKLPGTDILEVTTMCGHALISPNLVRTMVKEIKVGTKTPEEAAKTLTPNCTCGIFNPARAAELLAAMATKKS